MEPSMVRIFITTLHCRNWEPGREDDGIGLGYLRRQRAGGEERICREINDLRNRKVEKPQPHQVVRKCQSPVTPTFS
jgi:hypothetical protein